MSEVRTLLTGRGLVESPRWHGDRLYFSDWSAGEVIAFPNGMAVTPDNSTLLSLIHI